MDLPPPVQDPEPRSPGLRTSAAEDSLARRLDTVEARLVALGARLEQMEASLHQVIQDEGHTVSTEIRYTLSELGRRLALDLPQTLDRHRQMIVAELRPGGAGGTTAAPTVETGAGDPTATAAAGEAPADDGEAAVDDDAADDTPTDDTAEDDGDVSTESSNAGGRRKRRRRRGEG